MVVQGLLADADKGFHLQVLFEYLDKQLDMPAILVDGADVGGPDCHVVGQQNDSPMLFLVPDDDASQARRSLFPGMITDKFDDLVDQDVVVFQNRGLGYNCVTDVFLQSGHEIDPAFGL